MRKKALKLNFYFIKSAGCHRPTRFGLKTNGGFRRPPQPVLDVAISIEKSIFEQMDALAKKSNISRSRLFAIAAQEFIQRNQSVDLLESLNAAYDDMSDSEPVVTRMRPAHYKIVKDQW